MRAKLELLVLGTILISTLQAWTLGPLKNSPFWPFPSDYYTCTGDSFTRSDYETAKTNLDAQLTLDGIYVNSGSFVDTMSESATAYVCNYVSTWAPTWAVIFSSKSYDQISNTLDAQCGVGGGGFQKWQYLWVSTSQGRGNAANEICLNGNMSPCHKPPCPTGVYPTTASSSNAARATEK